MTLYDKEVVKERNRIEDVIGERIKLSKNMMGLCPFHDDREPSLSVHVKTQTWRCFGCGKHGDVISFIQLIEGTDFVGALEILAKRAGIEPTKQGQSQPEAEYIYHDEHGAPFIKAVRLGDGNGGKRFLVYRWDGDWKVGLDGHKPILYNLHSFNKSDLICIAEGEKCCDALTALGFVATTNPFGAGKWRAEYADHLRGKDIVVCADNDEAGKKHADEIVASLWSIASSIKLLDLQDLPPKGDIADWLQDHSKEDLDALINDTPVISEPVRRNTRRGKEFPCYTPTQLLNAEAADIKWLIEGIAAEGTHGIFGSEPKVCKSWIALELAYSLSTGIPFLGEFPVPSPQRVLFLQQEDGVPRLKRRFKQLIIGHGGAGPAEDMLCFVGRCGFRLDDTEWLKVLEDKLEDFKPALVIIDVLNKVHGAKESDQSEMTVILNILDELRLKYGCGFLLIHHLRKSDINEGSRINQRLRGSSVLAGWLEWAMFFRKAGESEKGIKVDIESKDGADQDPFLIYLEDLPDGGLQIKYSGTVGDQREAAAMTRVISAVEAAKRTGVTYVSTKRISEDAECDRKTARKHLQRMVERGRLFNDKPGARNEERFSFTDLGTSSPSRGPELFPGHIEDKETTLENGV